MFAVGASVASWAASILLVALIVLTGLTFFVEGLGLTPATSALSRSVRRILPGDRSRWLLVALGSLLMAFGLLIVVLWLS